MFVLYCQVLKCYNLGGFVSKFMNELGVFTFLTIVCRHQTENRERERQRDVKWICGKQEENIEMLSSSTKNHLFLLYRKYLLVSREEEGEGGESGSQNSVCSIEPQLI